MLVYRHPSHQPIVPPWLADFEPVAGSSVALCHLDTDRGHLVGIADPVCFAAPPERAFVDLDDGWQVAQVGAAEPALIARRPRWCRTVAIQSLSGEAWRAPIILGTGRERAFIVRYGGRDFLPLLTPQQERCEAVARAAADAVELDMGPEACQWAAVLLEAANHVPAVALAVLGLLDGQLVAETVAAATSRVGRYEPPGEAGDA